MLKMNEISNLQIVEELKAIICASRVQIAQTINTVMVQTYWNIGKMLIEDEQKGQTRAEYGTKQLEFISKELTQEFGKGFDVSNLRNMRRFYLTFPIQETLSLKLSWSHYCKLLKIENQNAREWYIKEAIANNWSVRALERQISVLYYERLLSSHKSEDDNPTIGIMLCSEHSNAVAKYSVLNDSKQLFTSKYLPFLPTVEELQKELLRERNLLTQEIADE